MIEATLRPIGSTLRAMPNWVEDGAYELAPVSHAIVDGDEALVHVAGRI